MVFNCIIGVLFSSHIWFTYNVSCCISFMWLVIWLLRTGVKQTARTALKKFVTITMHLSLYVYLNFPLLGIIPIILCNKAQPAKTWSAGWVTGRALRLDRRGQNASVVLELAGKSYGKLPCLLNTDNGTEEGLWWVKLHIGFLFVILVKW
jgi:hypothetical protein